MRRGVDWGHLAFVLAIAAAVAWYLFDTVSVSTAANNLLFVAPVCGIALLLCLVVVVQCLRPAAPADPAPRKAAPGGALRILGVAAALVALVALLDVIGFDGAILMFSVATMWACGERRPLPLLAYPLFVTLAVVLGFRAILPFPMYTLLL